MKAWIWKNKLSLIAVLAVLLTGYWLGQRRFYPKSPSPPQPPMPEFGIRDLPSKAPVTGFKTDEVGESEVGGELSSPSERLVVKSGTLSLLVKNVRESAEFMQKLATDLGGFVVDSQTDVVDERRGTVRAAVTVRIPAEKFDSALKTLKGASVKVSSETISGQDVTEEFTDLQSRLKNLEAAEAQLLKIMERAGEIKDVLAVQQELMRVRGQVEVAKGRVKFLQESAAMSKITAYFATEEEELPIVEERWRPLITVKEGLRALVAFWQALADKLIFWVIFLSPIIIALPVVWALRRRKL